jgi:hypothetical protein
MPEAMREFRYRRLVGGLTHDEYLEEPAVTVDWLLAIDTTIAEVEADQAKEAGRG